MWPKSAVGCQSAVTNAHTVTNTAPLPPFSHAQARVRPRFLAGKTRLLGGVRTTRDFFRQTSESWMRFRFPASCYFLVLTIFQKNSLRVLATYFGFMLHTTRKLCIFASTSNVCIFERTEVISLCNVFLHKMYQRQKIYHPNRTKVGNATWP